MYLLSFSARDSSIDIRGLNVLVAQLVLDFLGVGGIEHMHSNGMPKGVRMSFVIRQFCFSGILPEQVVYCFAGYGIFLARLSEHLRSVNTMLAIN